MRRHLLPLACRALVRDRLPPRSSAGRDAPSRAAATSPDGQIRLELSLADRGDGGFARLFHLLPRPDRSSDHRGWASTWPTVRALGRIRRSRRFDPGRLTSHITQHPGKRSRVVDHCEEVDVKLREQAGPGADAGRSSCGPMTTGSPFAIAFPPRRVGRVSRSPANAPGSTCPMTPWLMPSRWLAIRRPTKARYQKKSRGRDPRGLAARVAATDRAAGHRLARGDGGQPHRLRGDVPGTRRRREGPSWLAGSPHGPVSRRSPCGPASRTNRPGGPS